MTKSELIATLSTHNDIGSKTKADRILTFLKETIIAELSAGNQVALGQDFGTFKPVTRAARTGVNPTTKAAIQIPASKTIKFSISAPLKRELNN